MPPDYYRWRECLVCQAEIPPAYTQKSAFCEDCLRRFTVCNKCEKTVSRQQTIRGWCYSCDATRPSTMRRIARS